MFYGCLWALWYWSVEYISKTSWFSLLRIVGFLSSEDTNKRSVFKSDLYVLLVELNFYDVKWTFLKKQIKDQCLIVICMFYLLKWIVMTLLSELSRFHINLVRICFLTFTGGSERYLYVLCIYRWHCTQGNSWISVLQPTFC